MPDWFWFSPWWRCLSVAGRRRSLRRRAGPGLALALPPRRPCTGNVLRVRATAVECRGCRRPAVWSGKSHPAVSSSSVLQQHGCPAPSDTMHNSKKAAVLLLVSALSCTSAAMWAVRLSTMGLVRTEAPAAGAASTEAPASTSSRPAVDAAAEKDCLDQIGKVENGVVMNTMPKYDVAKILEELGGAAGKLNVSRNQEVPELAVAESAAAAEPLPDTDNATYYVYDYRRTDFKTFVRLEHALLRNKGKQDEFEDVRGELYWTPPDFCGRMRHAKYRVDREGFAADVTLEYCHLHPDEDGDVLTCATPSYCHTNATHQYCVG